MSKLRLYEHNTFNAPVNVSKVTDQRHDPVHVCVILIVKAVLRQHAHHIERENSEYLRWSYKRVAMQYSDLIVCVYVCV